jgi:hypothetical protein
MAEYTYPRTNSPNPRSKTTLAQDLLAAGLPVTGIRSLLSEVCVVTSRDLTPEEQSNASSLVTSYQARNEVDPAVPQQISARQIRLQLTMMGINLSDIAVAINQLPEPDRTVASLEWEYATGFERHNILIAMVGMLLGLTEAQLDQIWVEGSEL